MADNEQENKQLLDSENASISIQETPLINNVDLDTTNHEKLLLENTHGAPLIDEVDLKTKQDLKDEDNTKHQQQENIATQSPSSQKVQDFEETVLESTSKEDMNEEGVPIIEDKNIVALQIELAMVKIHKIEDYLNGLSDNDVRSELAQEQLKNAKLLLENHKLQNKCETLQNWILSSTTQDLLADPEFNPSLRDPSILSSSSSSSSSFSSAAHASDSTTTASTTGSGTAAIPSTLSSYGVVPTTAQSVSLSGYKTPTTSSQTFDIQSPFVLGSKLDTASSSIKSSTEKSELTLLQAKHHKEQERSRQNEERYKNEMVQINTAMEDILQVNDQISRMLSDIYETVEQFKPSTITTDVGIDRYQQAYKARVGYFLIQKQLLASSIAFIHLKICLSDISKKHYEKIPYTSREQQANLQNLMGCIDKTYEFIQNNAPRVSPFLTTAILRHRVEALELKNACVKALQDPICGIDVVLKGKSYGDVVMATLRALYIQERNTTFYRPAKIQRTV